MDQAPILGCRSDLHLESAPSDKPCTEVVAVTGRGEPQRGLALVDMVKLASFVWGISEEE